MEKSNLPMEVKESNVLDFCADRFVSKGFPTKSRSGTAGLYKTRESKNELANRKKPNRQFMIRKSRNELEF